MILWAVIILGVVILTLASLKGWAWVHTRANKLAKDAQHLGATVADEAWEWSTAESRIDDFVSEAENNWRYAHKVDFFFVACLFTVGMILLDIMFGWSRGGQSLNIVSLVYMTLLVCADVALPFVAINGDRSRGKWYEFKPGDRSASNWTLLVLFTFLSVIVVIGSTSETSTVSAARNDIAKIDYDQTRMNIEKWTESRNSIRVDRGHEALTRLADTEEELAKRERGRGGCGPKCDKHTKAASDYRSRADEAKRKEKLTIKIAKAREQLNGMRNVRTNEDPLAKFGSDALGIPTEVTRNWALTFIGLLLVLGNTILWMQVADRVTELKRAERDRRANIGDTKREAAGLPKKYTVDMETKAIEDHSSAPATDTITINAQEVDLKKRLKNDAQALEVNDLFGALIVLEADIRLPTVDLHRAYKIAKLKADANATYMTYQVFADKLATIAHFRDDVTISADGEIVGWNLAERQQMEAAE